MARFLEDQSNKIGSAPGSLIFVGEQKMDRSIVQVLRYCENTIEEFYPESFNEIKDTISPDHRTWINIYGLHNTDLIGEMGKVFDISPLFLEDILNTDQRPRFSEENDHLYIIAKLIYVNKPDDSIDIEQVSFIVGENYLITIQEKDNGYFEEVKKRIEAGKTRIRKFGSDYLCYALLDHIVDTYIINLEILGSAIEDEGKTIFNSNTETIKNLYYFKTELSYIRKNIRPFKEITARFASCDSYLIDQRTYIYLKDLDDLILQAQEAIEIYYTMVSDQINLFQTNINNKTNDVVKVLTIFSTIFSPLTFLVGIYGMNFKYMPELDYKSSYFILWCIMIMIAILMLLYFKRKKWIK